MIPHAYVVRAARAVVLAPLFRERIERYLRSTSQRAGRQDGGWFRSSGDSKVPQRDSSGYVRFLYSQLYSIKTGTPFF